MPCTSWYREIGVRLPGALTNLLGIKQIIIIILIIVIIMLCARCVCDVMCYVLCVMCYVLCVGYCVFGGILCIGYWVVCCWMLCCVVVCLLVCVVCGMWYVCVWCVVCLSPPGDEQEISFFSQGLAFSLCVCEV